MPRSRRRKPIPAALLPKLIEQLGPLDELLVRLVADDSTVAAARELVAHAHRKVLEAQPGAALSAQGARLHALAVLAHEAAVREVLQPALAAAQAERERRTAAAAPDHVALAGKVVQRVDGDRVLAVDALLRRNPHWRDPALWAAPEVVPYLARTVASEARYIGLRQRAAERPALSRGERPFRTPSETAAMRAEQARQQRVERGLRLLRRLQAEATPEMRRVVRLMAAEGCGPFTACRRLGLPRSTAVALRARADRLLSGNRKTASGGR